MEAFFAISLSIIVLRKYLRSEKSKQDPRELNRNTVKARWDRKRIKEEKRKQAAKSARKTDKEKRKQAEEIITVVLPTIRNDGE